jgi:O-antigen ligase
VRSALAHGATTAFALARVRWQALWKLAPWAVAATIWALVVLQGGEGLGTALGISTIQIALLQLWLWSDRTIIESLLSERVFVISCLIALALVIWLLLQLLPVGSGMAFDAWRLVGRSPQATLDNYASTAELAKFLGLGSVFTLGIIIAKQPPLARQCRLALSGCGIAYLTWIIARYVIAPPKPDYLQTLRLMGSFYSSNTTAALAGLMTVLGWTQLCLKTGILTSRNRRRGTEALRRLALPATLLCLGLISVALTGSRGGAMSTLVSMIAAGVIVLRGRRSTGGVAAAMAMTSTIFIFGVAIFFLSGTVAGRMQAASAGIADRQAILNLYVGRMEFQPWAGYGLGTFRRFNNIISASSDAHRLWSFGAMHNVYLQWIYEGGFPGAALMFSCLGWVLWNTATRRRTFPSLWRTMSLASSVLLLSHSMISRFRRSRACGPFS